MDGREGNGVYEDGADRVKEDLESAEEGFSEEGIEKYGFECGGEISIEPIYAEGFVVGEMVRLVLVSCCSIGRVMVMDVL